MAARGRGTDLHSEHENAERLIRGADDQWGWGGPAGRRRVARRVEFLSRALDARPGTSLLELGSGTGIFTEGMLRTGAHITCVDLSSVLVEEARRKLGRRENLELVVGDLMDPATLAGRRFDGVYGVSVLHHLDLSRALPAVARALKPGARFAFSEPNLDNPLNRYFYYVDDPERRARLSMSATEMAFTDRELRAELERHGFHVDALRFRDFLHPSTPGAFVPLVERAGELVERVPLLRRATGSLWVHGRFG